MMNYLFSICLEVIIICRRFAILNFKKQDYVKEKIPYDFDSDSNAVINGY